MRLYEINNLLRTIMKKLLFFFLLFVSINYAQSENVAFRNLTSAEGLPTTSINDVTQDTFGFIWIGSWDGVYKYDGKSFKKISGASGGRYVEADNNGGVWISFSSSIGYYDSYTDSLIIYNIPNPERYADIAIDGSGNVWTYSSKEIFKFDRKTRSFKRDEGQQTGSVIELNARADGELLFLIVTDNKFNQTKIGRRTEDGKYTYEPLPKDLNAPKKGDYYTEGWPIYLRFMDSTGILITNKYGLAYKKNEEAGWVFKKFSEESVTPSASDVRLDNSGNLWLNQFNTLSKINIATGITTFYTYDQKNPNSILPSSNLFRGQNLFIDKQGILWITKFSQGISRLNLYESDFGLLKDSPGSPITDVLSALEEKDGSFWIGARLRDNGLIHFSSDGKIIKRYGAKSFSSTPGKTVSTELSHPFAWSLAQTSDGSIWVGTGSPGPHSGGLNRIRPGSNLITRFKNDPKDSSSLSNDWAGQILVDGSDRVWVFSFSTVCTINPETEKITRGIKDPSSGTTDYSPYLGELVTSTGDLVIGTVNSGTNNLNKTFIINHKTLERKPFGPEKFPGNFIIYLHQDDKERIWFVTEEGFGYLDSGFKKIAYFYNIEKKDFPAGNIAAINSDHEDNIWLATDNGIIEFDPATESIKHFGFDRGLQGNKYNSYLNYKGPSGKIYFGGNGGINIFDPEKIRTNPYPPKMVFTDLKLDGKLIEPGKKSAIQKPVFATDKITVGPDVLTISIDFAAIHFAGFESNQYQYKLDGFDRNWIDGGAIGNATYTNLSPGKYTLFIKGSNWDGVWSNGKKSISIIILPPWWRTWWAYLLYAFLFVGILGGARKFELDRRKEKENKRILQLENKRKTQELEEARKLQLSMLPRAVPQLSNLDIAVYMQTATEVGGDYYDFSVGLDGTLNIALGDATGHGMQAGTLVTIMKGIFTLEAAKSEVIPFFNKSVEAIKEIKLGRLMMAFVFLKIKDNRVSLSNAGVPPVYIFRKDKNEVEEIDNKGMPLGAMNKFPYKETKTELNKGDVIYLLSDGLPELSNGEKEIYGYERIKKTFNEIGEKSAEEIIEHLKNTAKDWSGDKIPDDDVTFVVIKVK